MKILSQPLLFSTASHRKITNTFVKKHKYTTICNILLYIYKLLHEMDAFWNKKTKTDFIN